MMDNRQRQSLDNYITGHYGEDQYPPLDFDNTSGHAMVFYTSPRAGVYDYDPADDGPECEVITRVLAHHPLYRPGKEAEHLKLSTFVDATAKYLFGWEYAECNQAEKAVIRLAIVRVKATGRAL